MQWVSWEVLISMWWSNFQVLNIKVHLPKGRVKCALRNSIMVENCGPSKRNRLIENKLLRCGNYYKSHSKRKQAGRCVHWFDGMAFFPSPMKVTSLLLSLFQATLVCSWMPTWRGVNLGRYPRSIIHPSLVMANRPLMWVRPDYCRGML